MKRDGDPKERLLPLYQRKSTFEIFFCGIMLFACTYALLLLVYSKGGQQSTLFFSNPGDSFMDFFNVLKYISTRDPYHYIAFGGLADKAYPPLAYLILYPASRLYNYIDNSSYSARGSQLALMSLLIFLGICIIALALLIYQNKKGSSFVKTCTIAAMFSSGVFLFALERGNIILLAALFLGVFLFLYNSESAVMREIAYLSLACAVGLKVYPVLFGIIILKNKRWFAGLRTILYGAAAGFLPFLFFKGGFSNLSQLLMNIDLSTQSFKFLSPLYRFGWAAQYLWANTNPTQIDKWILIGNVLMVFSVALCLGLKKPWKTVMFLTCALIASPVNSAYYCGIYLLVPVVLFLNEKEHELLDWLYVVLFAAILNPYQFAMDSLPQTVHIANTALLILYLLLLLEAVFDTSLRLHAHFTRSKMQKIPENTPA